MFRLSPLQLFWRLSPSSTPRHPLCVRTFWFLYHRPRLSCMLLFYIGSRIFHSYVIISVHHMWLYILLYICSKGLLVEKSFKLFNPSRILLHWNIWNIHVKQLCVFQHMFNICLTCTVWMLLFFSVNQGENAGVKLKSTEEIGNVKLKSTEEIGNLI